MLGAEGTRVSIVLPCFRGEGYIERSIREAENEFAKFMTVSSFEIIVVVDGIVDKTMEIVTHLAEEFGNISVLGYESNRGKGYAIQYGVEKAKGKYTFMLDSDLDYDPTSVKEFLRIAEETGADIVVGNRRHPQSIFVYPLARKVSSYFFSGYVNALFRDLHVPDTQAGVKLLRSEVINRKTFPEIRKHAESNGFIFDVCLLVLARRSGLKIVSSPCIFRMHSSTIGIGKDFFRTSYRMWKEVLTFKLSLGNSHK